MKPEKVLLVCGARRTGTTLLAAILSADETTPPFPGEAQLLPRWLETYRWATEFYPMRALPFFEKGQDLDHFYQQFFDSFLDHCMRKFSPASALILKSPELSLFLPEAQRFFPAARILVTTRDPLDQVTSEWRILERRRGGDSDTRILEQRDFTTIAREYVRYYEPILRVADDAPGRIHFVRYEDLVANVESTLRRLERATGLTLSSFDPGSPWPRVAPSYWACGVTPSDTPQYGNPIDPTRVGSHTELLTPEEARLIREICGSVTSALMRHCGG